MLSNVDVLILLCLSGGYAELLSNDLLPKVKDNPEMSSAELLALVGRIWPRDADFPLQVKDGVVWADIAPLDEAPTASFLLEAFAPVAENSWDVSLYIREETYRLSEGLGAFWVKFMEAKEASVLLLLVAHYLEAFVFKTTREEHAPV